MIRRAVKEDTGALKAMWQVCFSDSEKAVGFIFNGLQKPKNTLVTVDGEGKPAAMLSIREFELQTPGNGCKAAYVYAVATMPEHRGKGLSTELLNNMHLLLADEGYACSVLVPAEPGLFDFYEKRGYETAFRLNRAAVDGCALETGEGLEPYPLSPEDFPVLRDRYFGGSSLFARWDESYLRFICEDCRFWGGGAYGFSAGGQAGYAICYRSGKSLLVKELAVPQSMTGHALASLHARFGAEKYVLYLREDVRTPYTNNILPFAMVKWYYNSVRKSMSGGGKAPAYIAHVLD